MVAGRAVRSMKSSAHGARGRRSGSQERSGLDHTFNCFQAISHHETPNSPSRNTVISEMEEKTVEHYGSKTGSFYEEGEHQLTVRPPVPLKIQLS